MKQESERGQSRPLARAEQGIQTGPSSKDSFSRVTGVKAKGKQEEFGVAASELVSPSRQ